MNLNFPTDTLVDAPSLIQILFKFRETSTLLVTYGMDDLLRKYSRFGNFDEMSGCYWVSNDRLAHLVADLIDENLLNLVDVGYVSLIWCDDTMEFGVVTTAPKK